MSTSEGDVRTQGTERGAAAEDVPGTAPCQTMSSTWKAGWGPHHLISQPTSQRSLICLIRKLGVVAQGLMLNLTALRELMHHPY